MLRRVGKGSSQSRPVGTLLAIDVPEGKSDEGLAIIQWELHGRDAQKWRVEAVDAWRGWYKVVNAYTGKALDIKHASKENRAILADRARVVTPSLSTGGSTNKTMGHTRYSLGGAARRSTSRSAARSPGTTLELCEDDNQANQRWMFKRSTQQSFVPQMKGKRPVRFDQVESKRGVR